MMTSWLVLCAAGGHEREAARVVNRNDGAAYIPSHTVGDRQLVLMPGYVFAAWLNEPPWHRLEAHKTRRGNALIWGALTCVGSDELARVPQRDLDIMEAYANQTADEAGIIRHKTGDLVPQKLGLTGAELPMMVTDIKDGLMTLKATMLGTIVIKRVKVAA